MLVFHPPGECHAEEHETDVATVNVEIDGSWLRRIAEFSAPLDQPVEFADDEIASSGMQILRELGHNDEDSALAIEGLTWEILAAAAEPRARRVAASAPRWLRDARDLLDSHIGEPTSLRTIAEKAGVHPVHFAATFRRYLGCSVGEYARRRRFEYARRELADADLPLNEVAVEAGFADQSHLTRTFKRLTGMTPKQYRTFLAFKTRG
jgi:AraC-like DNA-binding protein